MAHKSQKSDNDTIQIVREEYGKIAMQGGSCCGTSAKCDNKTINEIAEKVGYAQEELEGLPIGANMGLSCGNPTAIALLKPGEYVVDLGSGGGFDIFIASKMVGPQGRAIGIDMTPEMIAKARQNAEIFKKESGLDNMEFRLGEIEHLPVADSTIDVVISNCVINLAPNKAQVWNEIARILKPGGRIAVSDLALLKPLPDAIRDSVKALVGCIAGAILIDETKKMVKAAGLTDIEIETKSDYIDGMSKWSDPFYREMAGNLPGNSKPGDYITSMNLMAKKPA